MKGYQQWTSMVLGVCISERRLKGDEYVFDANYTYPLLKYEETKPYELMI